MRATMSKLVEFGEEDPSKEYYYRVEGRRIAHGGIDMMGEWEFSGSYSYALHLDRYEVLKHTAKGVWIATRGRPLGNPNNTNATFVNNHTTKRFALPTKEDALISFIARKEREASIYWHRGREAERFKKLALRSLPESHIPAMTTYLFQEILASEHHLTT